MISEKETFGARNCLAIFWIWGPLKKQNASKIRKIMNFGKFRKMHTPLQKGGRWNGCEKGVSLSVIQKTAFAENTIFIVFSAKHTNCWKKGTETLTKIVGCCSSCARMFFLVGCCVACSFLNGWLCGVSVLLCYFSSFNGLCFCCCVSDTGAHMQKCLFSSIF